MAKLAAAVFVKDPDRAGMLLLQPGEEPEPRIAALITSPEAWEDGKLPTAAKKAADSSDGDDDGDKQAARKSAAKRPARGRSAATEGEGGD